MAYGAALALVTVVNYFVLTRLPLPVVPVLIQMMVVAVGILEGAPSGAGFGIAAGVVLSAATHGSMLWVCVLPLAGWVCGLLAQYVLRRDFVGYLLAGLGSMLICEVLQVGSRLLAGTAELSPLLKVAAGEFVWTMVLSAPIYGLCYFCCRYYGRIYHE